MMTVMCPNCRHRFPAPGCCNPVTPVMATPVDQFSSCHVHSGGCSKYCIGGGYLVPRGYLSGGGCVINSPTIIHGPTTIVHEQNVNDLRPSNGFSSCRNQSMDTSVGSNGSLHLGPSSTIPSHCQIGTTCNISNTTGGSATITTTAIQSGGCLIQSGDLVPVTVQPSRIEIQPNLLSGVCVVRDPIAVKDNRDPEKVQSVQFDHDREELILNSRRPTEENLQQGIFQNPHPMLFPPPSGCQELPGTRRSSSPKDTTGIQNNIGFHVNSANSPTTNTFNFTVNEANCPTMSGDWSKVNATPCNHHPSTISVLNGNSNSPGNPPHPLSKFGNSLGSLNMPNLNLSSIDTSKLSKNFDSFADSPAPTSTGPVIQVNATLQLPPNVAHCTVSITATANSLPSSSRSRNNFNGGGIVETDSFGNAGSVCDKEDATPTTPVSWVLPFPWGLNGNSGNNSTDLERLSVAQRVLQISGWYHEGLSWQQSAMLLKSASVGSWLMRDSSDERFVYAVSVQTARGPTAVRVHYVCGRFRLDAEPRMAPLMPMFECPVKMIEHYIEYSKKMEEQKEVWVDHSGQLYSQIYLTKPLLKEVRSLSHLARLTVNRHKIPTKDLPTPLKDYLAEYPYTQ